MIMGYYKLKLFRYVVKSLNAVGLQIRTQMHIFIIILKVLQNNLPGSRK